MEDKEETSFSEGGMDTDEGTLTGRPAALDAKFFVAAPTRGVRKTASSSEQPQWNTSSPSSAKDRGQNQGAKYNDLYDVSDSETEFSDTISSIRDSVSSDPTSFEADSNRSSVASSKSGRNRYPSIVIPQSTAWPQIGSPFKASPMPPTPPPQIDVPSAALARIGNWLPSVRAPPSLDSGSSVASDQLSTRSMPATPEMRNETEGTNWGRNEPVRLREEPDSARDVDSDMSPQEEILIEDSEGEPWSAILGHFPGIPGELPEARLPALPDLRTTETSPPSDNGVLLPQDALQVLNNLVPDRSPDFSSNSSVQKLEMRERSSPPSRPRSADGVTPLSENSGYSFSKLSIPSPGGFFSSLKAGARHTWCPGKSDVQNSPDTSTAENFYDLPWNRRDADHIVERVVEVKEDLTEGEPTARQTDFNCPDPKRHSTSSVDDGISAAGVQPVTSTPEIRYEYEEAYEQELMDAAATNLDRTSLWLSAQTSYMSALREANPLNDKSQDWTANRPLNEDTKADVLDSPMKKTVRFLEEAIITTNDPVIGTDKQEKESIFHQAFRHMLATRKRRDAFVHATARAEAVQSLRVALKELHLEQLLGKYEIREAKRPKYSGPFSQNPRQTGNFELTPAQLAFRTVEREKAALDQIEPSFWVIDSLKYLNGHDNIFASPVTRRLDRAALPLTDPKCVGSKRFRVLDLGGNTAADWAWHVAHRWPNVKVYTVVNKTQTATPKLAGPANHRQVSVPHVSQLPFKDGHFDAISARNLHALLKNEPVPTQKSIDEYDLCLKECMRVLKPGGYLEFMVMDASIAHAGPLGSAMSVEFGFNLKTRGYDAAPTKVFLKRLKKAGYVGSKRAWMFLPMGSPPKEAVALRETPRPNVPSLVEGETEAVLGPVGETGQVANITGLLGAWMWEQWMLRLQMEMGREGGKLLEGMEKVIEEGRRVGSGWRVLAGWARKPRDNKVSKGERGTIRLCIDKGSG